MGRDIPGEYVLGKLVINGDILGKWRGELMGEYSKEG